ncbi:hypothetical protein [Caulobacter phage Cr30]|uniref:hypothetical protein n=1 Tax=Caulobacter phage Cr30 TaxID=1357714 RepID=UPI0004A9BB2A|nr:hypothetical protein OZ74_gp116 [Caulobacter phage Cr30]AGS81001.1 hypothetical protein [Caulobacter phage Cr30]
MDKVAKVLHGRLECNRKVITDTKMSIDTLKRQYENALLSLEYLQEEQKEILKTLQILETIR